MKSLRKEVSYETTARQIEADVKRFDEMTQGIEEALSREPEIYPIIPGTDVQYIKAVASGRRITVFFVNDDEFVKLLYVYEEEVL